MPSSGWKASWPLALGIAAASVLVPQQALAQFFFRPFGFAYRSEAPEEAPLYASRRAVAGILGREGFRLIGPLGHRGEQIVAMGVSRRDGEMRFIIDPYEGRILRAVRLGLPPMYDRGPGGEPDYAPPAGGARPYAHDLGEDDGPRAEQPRRAPKNARLRDAPPERPADQRGPAPLTPAPLAPQGQPPASAPTPRAAVQPTKPATPPPAPPAVSPPPARDPAPVATQAPDAPAKATQPAAPAQAAPEPKANNQPPKNEPAPKAATPAPAQNGAKASEAPRTTAARSTAGSTKRAIVPPPAANGTTAVTPAVKATTPAPTPPAPATAKTPVNADTPKQGG